ncbi:hypothetical protein SAMN05428964_103393 [Thalassospira xiamenensis]|uniref:Uncharacterized protein n=2 Tax=Thalassospira xiamenensis TaxID=220697 RepID=A0A285TGN9_9PROT|nr:hypothetical protein SAMN05428964_103393 [Thalassospira xiamenensis]
MRVFHTIACVAFALVLWSLPHQAQATLPSDPGLAQDIIGDLDSTFQPLTDRVIEASRFLKMSPAEFLNDERGVALLESYKEDFIQSNKELFAEQIFAFHLVCLTVLFAVAATGLYILCR